MYELEITITNMSNISAYKYVVCMLSVVMKDIFRNLSNHIKIY